MKKIVAKKFIVLLLILSTAISITACGKTESMSSDNKIKLKLLRLGDFVKAEPIFLPIVESFEAEHENIEVEFMAMGWGEAATKLRLLAEQEELPDVTFINIANGWDLALEGYLMDLSSKVESDSELSSELSESIINTIKTADGKLYWVPAAAGAFGLWYNKELFEEAGLDPDQPPQTMEEMVRCAQIITEKTGIPGLGFGIKAKESFAHVVMSFYSSYSGVELWDDKTRTYTFANNEKNRKAFIEALEMMSAIVNDYNITQPNPVEYEPSGELRPLFRDGKIAMHIDGVWLIKELHEELQKGVNSKFMTALFPKGSAGSHPIMGCDGWAIPESCKHKEEAWLLIKHLMGSENQTRHATQWGLLPILNSEQDKEEFAAPYWKALFEQQKTVVGRPKDKQVAMIEMAVAENAQAAILREITPDEAIDNMIKTVEANLKD